MEYTILNTNKYSVTEFKIWHFFLKDWLKFFRQFVFKMVYVDLF